MSAKRRRFDFTSLAGLPVSVGLILIGMRLEGEALASILHPTAAIIVFGGTLGAVLLSFSVSDVRRAFGALRTVFMWEGEPPSRTIDMVMKYVTHARTAGILALEEDLPAISDPFLRKALGLVVDGAEPHALREMLETESQSREEYDEIPAKVYEAAGGYAPTVGILGAVLGLIHIMQNLSDPSKLGTGIATAFVATVYGVGSANLMFLPMAMKLKMKSRHLARRRELIFEAVLAIQEGQNPRLIHEKLHGFAAQTAPGAPERRKAA